MDLFNSNIFHKMLLMDWIRVDYLWIIVMFLSVVLGELFL